MKRTWGDIAEHIISAAMKSLEKRVVEYLVSNSESLKDISSAHDLQNAIPLVSSYLSMESLEEVVRAIKSSRRRFRLFSR